MSTISRFFYLCFAWALATPSWAANDRALIWKLTHEQAGKPAATAYIFGSIHMATADIYPLREEIEQAFNRSKYLVVELDINDQNHNINQLLQERGLYKPPESLRDHLPAATLKRLQTYIAHHELDEAALLQQRPALLSISLSLQQLQTLNLDSALGLDHYFLQKARQLNKPIRALETIDDQLSALFAFPDDALIVEQTLNQTERLPTLINDLMQAWKDGDTDAIAALLLETDNEHDSVRFKPLMEAMFYQRNRRMVEKLDNWLQKDGGTYFVVVGSGHLAGEQNIIDLLQQKGYSLKQF